MLKKLKKSQTFKKIKMGWKRDGELAKTKVGKVGATMHTISDFLVFIFALFLLLFEYSTNWQYGPMYFYNQWKLSQTKSKKQKAALIKAQKASIISTNNVNTLKELKNKNGYITREQVDKYGTSNKMYIITDPASGVEYYYANSNITPNSSSHSGVFVMQPRLNNDKSPMINPYWKIRQKKEAKNRLTQDQKITILEKLSVQDFKGSIFIVKNNHIAMNQIVDAPERKNTIFPINSVQKNMTAYMLYNELSKKHIPLTTTLNAFYPKINGSSQITIRNLLNMTSGLTLTDSAYKSVKSSNDLRIVDELSKYAVFNSDLLNEPKYSSFNYVLLSGVLMKVTHKTYQQLFDEYFTKPLGLKHTSLLYNTKQKFAPGYQFSNINVPNYTAVHTKRNEWHNLLGAGSLGMSSSDLYSVLKYEMRHSKTNKDLWQNQTNGLYSGGFYSMKDCYEVNGAGHGYYTIIRSDKNAENMIILQTNYTKRNFDVLKKMSDEIWKSLQIK